MNEWYINLNLPLLYQIAIQGVSFFLFFTIVKTMFYAKVKGIMEEREKQITSGLDSADEATKKAEQIERECKAKMESLEEERIQMLKEASDASEALKAKIIADAQKQAAEIVENAKKDIKVQQERAEKEFVGSMIDLTIEAAEKIVGKSLNKEDHMNLISESINQFKEV
ncbi:MAG: F0F1 ATP synthase subunit B [Eubacteriaceae bacterium]|nr:F0F1 ATP synthase subunit B [Eubacteriaceae bacterium]